MRKGGAGAGAGEAGRKGDNEEEGGEEDEACQFRNSYWYGEDKGEEGEGGARMD